MEIIKRACLTAAMSILCAISMMAQTTNPLTVKHYKLENGLSVYLNEDHSKPEIFGAVVVKAGSKNDPVDATGIAHYFEHIMFKGTDQIGTLNYPAEKVYLDSIVQMYDQLYLTKEEKARQDIQMKINGLSIKASDYAIPNEVDILLRDIGGSGINAYTSLEQTVYHNSFPSNQVEKWMDIYAERFRNPVFRLFQSELETVYEEKNMYADNPMTMMFEDVMKTFYKKHPYGQQTTIGTIEHLKNPRLSKMLDFFRTYYVANNMALVLCGDFDTEKVIPVISEKFGSWRTGKVPPYPDYKEAPFKGREFRKVKMTPIRIGVYGFRTVPNNDPDEVGLQLCNQILSNESSTGLFDKLVMENKLLSASAFEFQGNDMGGTFIIFLPKIIGQSFASADKIIRNCMDSLKKGKFSDELLEGLKLNYRKSREKMLENSGNRADLLIDAFVKGITWDDVLTEIKKVESINKEEIIRLANKYYGENYMAYWSGMGFPKKEKIKKPDWKPVVPKNTEAKSEFAKKLDQMKETELKPRFINFKTDLQSGIISEGVTLYKNDNPYNDVFSLSVQFKTGKIIEPKLEQAVQFMNLIGTEEKSYQQFHSQLQKLGASCWFSVSDNYLNIDIDGFESKLEPTLKLVNEILVKPKSDEKQLEKFIQEAKANFKVTKNDPETIGTALYNYAAYKNMSPFLRRLSLKEIKKLKGDQLIACFKTGAAYDADIYYTGKNSFEKVVDAIKENITMHENPSRGKYVELVPLKYDSNTVFINHHKKALQTKIYFLTIGNKLSEKERAIIAGFNEYFGAGMSSLVFQEIREFRSLSYSAHAYFLSPYFKENPGRLRGYMGTQSDKTLDGLKAMNDLFVNMPVKPERMDGIRKALLQSVFTEQPDFRDLPERVAYWINQGYTSDPREYRYSVYNTMGFNDITGFYHDHVYGKPLLITLAGNMKKVNKEELKKFGKIIEVKQKEIIKE